MAKLKVPAILDLIRALCIRGVYWGRDKEQAVPGLASGIDTVAFVWRWHLQGEGYWQELEVCQDTSQAR